MVSPPIPPLSIAPPTPITIAPTTTVEQMEDSEEIDPTWNPLDNVSDSDDTDREEYIGLDEDELKECSFFAKYDETYDCDENMFTNDDLEEMKTRERVMMERTQRGYYRSKTDHEQLYLQIMDEYARFITRAMLLMLIHPYSTQKNEAMNTSVAALAPKTKHYCTTNSLLTRVGISAACQILGHATFWSLICTTFDFEMDPNLLAVLRQRDTRKRQKNVRQGTIEGKRKRSSNKHEKINKEHKAYMDGYKDGCLYETGIAVAVAKKNLPKAGDRNPPGTPKEMTKCPYYPMYCVKLGHVSCANANCDMKKATKEERAVALKAILVAKVDVEMIRVAGKCRFFIVMV